MPFEKDNPVVVGAPTKADDFDDAFDNTLYNFKRITGIAPADDNDVIGDTVGHSHEGSGEGLQLNSEGIADNEVKEVNIEDTDLPEGFRSYASTTVGAAPTVWTEDFDPGANLSDNVYTVPSDGVYCFGAQIETTGGGSSGDVEVNITSGSLGSLAYCVAATLVTNTIVANCHTIINLSAADTITFTFSSSGDSDLNAGIGKTFIYGYKLPWTTNY